MSFECMAWAIDKRVGNVSAKAVLMHLANCTNKHTWMCRPRIKVIAIECEISETTVKASLRRLEELGLILTVPRFKEGIQLSNDYQLRTGGVGQIPTPGGSDSDPGVGQIPTPVEPGSIETGIETRTSTYSSAERTAAEPQSAGIATAVTAQAQTSPQPQAREELQAPSYARSSPPPSSANPPPRKRRAALPEFVPPTLEEWLAYLPEHEAMKFMPKLDAESSYDYYSTNEWRRKDGSKVKDWKHTLRDCGRRWRSRNQDKYMEMMRFEQTRARESAATQQRSLPDDF